MSAPDVAGIGPVPAAADPRCGCRSTLVDYVRRTVGHPYVACPHYGTTTPLDDPRPTGA